jgi:hypothetical protein
MCLCVWTKADYRPIPLPSEAPPVAPACGPYGRSRALPPAPDDTSIRTPLLSADPCRSTIDDTHQDLALVGQIRNANDGSEGITRVGGDHGCLVERDTAGRGFPLESGPVIGRQTLSNLENLAGFRANRPRFRRRGRRRHGSSRAGRDNHNRQHRQAETGHASDLRQLPGQTGSGDVVGCLDLEGLTDAAERPPAEPPAPAAPAAGTPVP